MPPHDVDIEALRESPISFRLSELNEGLGRNGQPDDETVSDEDSAVMSPRQEPRRQFTRKEKGKKKTPEYDFGSAKSVRSESDVELVEKGPSRRRSKSTERVAKSGNHELRRSTRQKNPVKRYGYNEYMAHHYVYMTRVAEVREPTSYAGTAEDANWRATMEEEMCALTQNETGNLVDAPKGV
jgi:hypothetical protein